MIHIRIPNSATHRDEGALDGWVLAQRHHFGCHHLAIELGLVDRAPAQQGGEKGVTCQVGWGGGVGATSPLKALEK